MNRKKINTEPILICISGWGSRCKILEPLIRSHPLLLQRRRIELQWQDFVALALGQQPQALYSVLCQSLALKPEQNADLVLLGWSLGSLLSLELALQLQLQNPKWQLRLILLNPTAAMCPAKATVGPLDKLYPTVSPVALKIMQRKLLQEGNTVLAEFTASCLATGQDKEAFVSGYLQEAKSIAPQDLQRGLDYLLQCDLRQQFRQTALLCPALLLCGKHDAIIPCAQGQALAQQLPCSYLHIFDAGHNLLLPPPEAMNQVITEFLASTATMGRQFSVDVDNF